MTMIVVSSEKILQNTKPLNDWSEAEIHALIFEPLMSMIFYKKNLFVYRKNCARRLLVALRINRINNRYLFLQKSSVADA